MKSVIKSHAEKGMTIPMVAAMIVVLFIMAALAVDIGVLLTARTSAQHAADAAALAGAFTFLDPVAAQPGAATEAAIAVAAQTKVLGEPAAITAGDVNVDVANRRVTVNVPRLSAAGNGVATYFARVINIQSADVQTRATAEASPTGTGSNCLKPVYIPNTLLADKSYSVDQACGQAPSGNANPPQVLFDADGNLTAWAKSQMGNAAKIRPSDPSDKLAPGQFYSLDFGSGANTYRCTLGQCLNACGVSSAVTCGSSYPLKTGDMVGPTRQGIDNLIGKPPDIWQGIGRYQDGSTGVISDTSQSLVVAPVWDSCKQKISPGYAGQKVKVIGFLEMFIDGMQGKDVQAHLVSPIACSTAGGASGGTGPFAIPVRLVQTP